MVVTVVAEPGVGPRGMVSGGALRVGASIFAGRGGGGRRVGVRGFAGVLSTVSSFVFAVIWMAAGWPGFIAL